MLAKLVTMCDCISVGHCTGGNQLERRKKNGLFSLSCICCSRLPLSLLQRIKRYQKVSWFIDYYWYFVSAAMCYSLNQRSPNLYASKTACHFFLFWVIPKSHGSLIVWQTIMKLYVANFIFCLCTNGENYQIWLT